MTIKTQRRLAIGAVRSEIRARDEKPYLYSSLDALAVLDDLLRKEPDLVASQWYAKASDTQIRLFREEWERWCRETIDAIEAVVVDDDYRIIKR